MRELSDRLSPATVEVGYRYLSAVFKAAVADRLIPSSPCAGVKLPRAKREQIVPLTTDQVLTLADTIGDRHRALVLAAAGTGLRQGEAFGLTVDRVDSLHRQLRVDRQLLTLPKQAPAFGPPKTLASVRTVPLPAATIDLLAAHLATFGPGELGLIFTNDGRPWQRKPLR